MDEETPDIPKKPLPFNNLYLNSGVVNGYNSAWMYFLTLTFLITGYVFFQAIVMLPLMNVLIGNGYGQEEIIHNPNLLFDSNALRMDRNLVLLLELGMFVFAFIGFMIGLRFIHKKTLTSILTGYQRFRFSRFFFAFFLWTVLLVITVVVSYLSKPEDMKITFDAWGILISLVVMLVFMPIQTGLEEMVFRGYLVQGMSQLFRNGIVPLIITTLLFGAAHMSNPEVKQYGWPIMLTYYCVFAFFMGAVTLIDEGLELAFGIHFANNIISSVLISSKHSVVKTYSIFEIETEDPYSEIVVWFCMATITFFIFRYKYRWKNLQLIVK